MSEPINIYDFSKRTTEEKYPYVRVMSPNNTTPLIVGVLDGGEVPLVVEMSGKRKVVARISSSAYNIDKLIRTCGSLEYVKGAEDRVLINNVRDYMEVFAWT